MRTVAVIVASTVAVVDRLDIGGIAAGVIHLIQLVENARSAWHAREGHGRFYSRDNGRRSGQSEHTGKK